MAIVKCAVLTAVNLEPAAIVDHIKEAVVDVDMAQRSV